MRVVVAPDKFKGSLTAAQVAEAQTITDIVCVQNHYNLAHRDDDVLIDELARQGIAYVPIVDRPRNYTALAWHPAGLSREAAQLVRHVREEWSFGEGQAVERPATYY